MTVGVGAPISGQAITLANSIIGVGILAMPFCFKQCGIILSIIILIGSGVVSRLSCHFLLKSAIYSRRDNFESLAYHVFGSAGKFAAEIGIIGFLMGTCIAYFVVVGDLGPQIIAKMFNWNQSDFLRTCVMAVVSLVCVLPLGLLRNVDSLSNVCVATIGFYFCLVFKILVEAANPLLSGEWISKVEYWRPQGVLQCLPIFSMALCCQTQLFEIYDSLPNATLDRMNNVTKNAVNICTAVYILVGLFGYVAFCHQPISGNILISFSPTMGSDIIQVGFVMSLAFSFPLIIFPCRASLYSLLYRKGQSHNQDLINNLIPKMKFKCLTVSIIVVTLVIGVMLPNIELVLGLVGSTIGIMICVIFPSTCFICMSVKNTNERILAQAVLCCGIVIMVLGTYANLQAAEMDNVGLESKLAMEVEKQSSNNNKIISPKLFDNDIKENNIMEAAFLNEPPRERNPLISSKESNPAGQSMNSDSKIQPPNPVPPAEETLFKLRSTSSAIEAKKSSENINKYEKVEGAGDKEVQVEVNVPLEKANLDGKDEKNKVAEEINDEKEAALMKTIKKYAEEQRQMVEEQKEILQEIKEMKKDIESKQKEETNKNKKSNHQAVENIKKLAQAAIKSLQDDIPTSTDATVPKQVAKEADNTHLKSTEKVHVHQQDQPESYKAAEEAIHINGKNNSPINLGSVIPLGEVPIAIALSKANKLVAEKKRLVNESFKQKSKIELSTEKVKAENINKGDEIERLSKKTIKETGGDASPDYLGGKRDILQVHTGRTVLPNLKLIHNRSRRDTAVAQSGETCTKHKLQNTNIKHSLEPLGYELESNKLLYHQFNTKSVEYYSRTLKSSKAKR